jgi:predicted nucleotidyltransferase
MFKDITTIDLRILSVFVRDYTAAFSIRRITTKLKINYSNAYKRVMGLVKEEILVMKKVGQVNHVSFNIRSIDAVQVLSFVEEQESKKLKYSILRSLVYEAVGIDPYACIGLFGSRVSGKATKHSDWDIFIISEKKKEMEKIMSKFPFVKDIQLQVFTRGDFEDSLLSVEETVVRHIIRNKLIIYNPYPFYNIVLNWEELTYAPSQTS